MDEIGKEIDLVGSVCPFCIMNIIREADMLRSGETVRVIVDDPLAIKSAPEELGDYADISLVIKERGSAWEIVMSKE